MDSKSKKALYIAKFKHLLELIFDGVLMDLGILAALLLQTDYSLLKMQTAVFLYFTPLTIILTVCIFYLFGVHRVIWRYASLKDIYKLALAAATVGIFNFVTELLLSLAVKSTFISFRIYIVGTLISMAVLVFYRMLLRQCRRTLFDRGGNVEKVLVIGAGNASALVIKDLKEGTQEYKLLGIIDDDPEKKDQIIRGVPIVGNRNEIIPFCKSHDVDTIFFCIPSCPFSERVKILDICSRAGCQVKVMPSVLQIIDGKIDRSIIRSVEIEDLLERAPIEIDGESLKGVIRNKNVLVTGGGGSIGSELCRQIAERQPKCLVIFDIYENNAYAIQNELKRRFPEMHLEVLIGSVRDENRLESLFEEYRFDLVFHAAAHKHVPLMEDSPLEAIKNNVFGTYNTAKMADKYGCKRFVMISTDKAVNPTNVMGATKRLCEMVIQNFSRKSKTSFVAVRFGNVLGSNGSVVPLFKEQIARGGPVTVTHPEINRFFMTIPEAVSLVLEAGSKAKGGEIFVLDMGKPVKILDMAEKLIRLSGYEPYEEIQIVFSGLRPGEKLYEELLMSEEGLTKTENDLIYVGKPITLPEDFEEKLKALKEATLNEETDARTAIGELVPTYVPPKE